MPFCSECGAKLPENSKFCSECGTPAPGTQPQQTPQPYPQQARESIQGIIHSCKHGIPVNVYTLFLTENRIIAAKTAGVLGNLATTGAIGGGIVGSLIGASLDNHRNTKKTEELTQYPPDQILAQDKKNFQIPYNTIQTAEMKPPGILGMAEIKLNITSSKPIKFNLEVNKEIFQQNINAMNQALPGRIITK